MNIYISCMKEGKNPVIQIPSQNSGLNFLFSFFSSCCLLDMIGCWSGQVRNY